MTTDILARSDHGLAFTRLQPTIGAEVSGSTSPPRSRRCNVRRSAPPCCAVVIFFRDQVLTDAQQAAFAGQFGPLYTHPTTRHNAGLTPIHAIAAEDLKHAGDRYLDHLDKGDAYHTDTSWRLVPTWGAVLRDVKLPEVGGDTIWVDAHLAWKSLPEALQQRLEGLHVTHNFLGALKAVGHEYPIVAHPLVRRHRETGEKILWVNFSQQPQILGVELAESRDLLAQVLQQYKRPELQVRFSWRPNSVAFWDNRAAVHYAVRNYGDFRANCIAC
jgi:taurine dioxygenase